ncbi:allantoinase AllB [Salisediminibacterium selenitireducens]|uniref:Allantoinase n=1 Tax=Bacillus selenitireducens (strain ATCC 700615 / DSM 15326 / MLS10) TaxID=439292 RepID=D6XY37_BACIE|nr:allantoinase AllB [Salisediminibacterium selenitireducens]ADH98110.1 allantoinase [[Bacillus] selenitireducens MLS10]
MEVFVIGTQWIRNGTVWTGTSFVRQDIEIRDGIIDRLFDSHTSVQPEPGARITDAADRLVVPGFIDPHVHFNDPGRRIWEGIDTGSKAAVAGGITTFIDMPLNSHPSVTNGHLARDKKKAIEGRSHAHYGLWGGITRTNCRDQGALDAQLDAGVIGFKGFMSESGIEDFPYLDRDALREAMGYCGEHRVTLALHAEAEAVLERYRHLSGPDPASFLASRPPEAEWQALDWIIEDALRFQTAVHVVHVSTADGVRMLHEAKMSGADITIETCPHYLLFTDTDFIKKGPLLKCAPPLRPLSEQEALWQTVADGLVDIIGSDHSPCPLEMKEAGNDDIRNAWGGIPGVQSGHAALLSEAVKRGVPLETVLPMMTDAPARRFFPERQIGRIAPGFAADLTLLSKSSHTITEKELLNRHPYSPYTGLTVDMTVSGVFLGGVHIYQSGKGIKSPLLGHHFVKGGHDHDNRSLRRIY